MACKPGRRAGEHEPVDPTLPVTQRARRREDQHGEHRDETHLRAEGAFR
ncbi:hypothetical protein X945_5887 [Burkholderia pseudomallei ABCPW 107]|nr:hypothetical protein X977_5758 [Burkholderia pseudomallei MSHR7504]KGS34998.1 hypothetical protein X945_5887 [Burkholderia pseudomallei ABCPW 107]